MTLNVIYFTLMKTCYLFAKCFRWKTDSVAASVQKLCCNLMMGCTAGIEFVNSKDQVSVF